MSNQVTLSHDKKKVNTASSLFAEDHARMILIDPLPPLLLPPPPDMNDAVAEVEDDGVIDDAVADAKEGAPTVDAFVVGVRKMDGTTCLSAGVGTM